MSVEESDFLVDVLQNFGVKAKLVSIVAKNQCLVESRRGGDIIDPRAAKTMFRKDGLRGRKDRFAASLPYFGNKR